MDARTLIDKLAKANIPYESVADTLDFVYALANDRPIWIDNKPSRYYSFNNMPQDSFTDIMLEQIAEALRKSKQAEGITLFHGYVTDKGMKLFIDALKETKAPISELCIDDLQGITDASLKDLPTIIKTKGIAKCDVSGYLKISDNLKQEINKATAEVRKSMFDKGKSTLKQKKNNSNQIKRFLRKILDKDKKL